MLEFDLSPEEADVFLQEAEEMLLQLNDGLIQLEHKKDDSSVVQQVFRAAHTLKGSAGVIGHERMANLLHAMETLLDRVRHNEMDVSSELIDVLLQGADAVRALVGEVSSGEQSDIDLTDLKAKLDAFVTGSAVKPKQKQTWETMTPPAAEANPTGAKPLEIRGMIAKDSVAPGARALQILLALQECGKLLECSPRIEELDDNWQKYAVQALLVADDVNMVHKLLGSISEVQYEIVGEPAPAAEPVQQPVAAESEQTPAAATASNNGKNGRGESRPSKDDSGSVKWVRTSVERLDKLMNLVSELVTDRNRLLQLRGNLEQRIGEDEALSELAEAMTHTSTITDQLQDEVMRARMVPIEHVFNKFPRVVRDLARQLNKDVELVIEGQDTELDRTVIEEINDPLMHLVRNCLDHGVETPADRVKAGKNPRGTVRMAARSEESHIIIVIEDDGAGMDPEVLRQVAVRKGIMDAESARQLSDQEAIELIFQSGFSSAKVISNVSGRGVGMDVVRTNIERLNGSVAVQTKIGEGTRFELKLPLTLAIFPALMVEVAGNAYAIPLTSVVEALHVRQQDIHTVRGRETIINRGQILPILRLDEFFRIQERNKSLYVVEVRWGEATIGLAVHRLLGRQEVVIKPLGRMIGEVEGISGGTIMGDGRVALIMDIPSLVKTAKKERQGAA